MNKKQIKNLLLHRRSHGNIPKPKVKAFSPHSIMLSQCCIHFTIDNDIRERGFLFFLSWAASPFSYFCNFISTRHIFVRRLFHWRRRSLDRQSGGGWRYDGEKSRPCCQWRGQEY